MYHHMQLWVAENQARESPEDEQWLIPSQAATTEEKITEVRQTIVESQRVTIRIIAQKAGIRKEMCQSHDFPGVEYEKSVCTVPTQESDKRSEIHAQDVSGKSSVTGTTGIGFSAGQSYSWFTILTLRQNSSPCSWNIHHRCFQINSGRRCWLARLWQQLYGVMMVDFLQKDPIVTGDNYSNLLQNLTDSVAKKCPEKMLLGVLHHHDNAPQHRVQVTVHNMHECRSELLPPPHPPTPLTWHLLTSLCFPKWKGTCVFAISIQMMLLLMRWCSVVMHKKFLHAFFKGIQKLQHWWRKCVELLGDHTEKS